jgi:hypothetical protein
MVYNTISFDFKTNRLCNQPESNDFKTIQIKLTLYKWLYVYNHDFVAIDDPDIDETVKRFTRYGTDVKDESYTSEYDMDDGEFCNAYRYVYTLNNETLILYKIVPYSCDWVANPDYNY